MAYGDKTYGLRDVQIKQLPGGSAVDLPAAQTFTFTEKISSAEMRGDDAVVAVVSNPVSVEWSLEAGGINLEAWAAMTGRTVATAGTTPDEAKTYTASADDVFPYFMVAGKSVGDGIDDIHVILYKCKLTEPPNGSFGDEEFMKSKISGIAIDDGSNGIMDIVQNETAADISL